MIRRLLPTLHKPIYDNRQSVLVQLISPHLKPGARVLEGRRAPPVEAS
jgi:hypothetical protein